MPVGRCYHECRRPGDGGMLEAGALARVPRRNTSVARPKCFGFRGSDVACSVQPRVCVEGRRRT